MSRPLNTLPPPAVHGGELIRQDRRRLEDLCKEYVAAGWMTAAQSQTYQRILQQHPETLEYIVKEIQAFSFIGTTTDGSSSLASGANHSSTSQCVYLPEEFHKVHSSSNSENPQSLKELFVEMCFFARLGYIQPPCCLKCAYLQNSHSACTRWVVWRRNANEILHPDTLPDNVVVLPCGSAQQLWQSPHHRTCDGYYWDSRQKQLMHTSSTTK